MHNHCLRHIVLALGLVAFLGGAVSAIAQDTRRCFPETGYCITGRIRSFWEQNGGLLVFGFPITPQHAELVEGQMFETQWFERTRLELHPENAPPYDVLLGRLGVDRLRQQDRDWHVFPASKPETGCRFFTETRHNVCGNILASWRAHGLEFDGRAGTSEAESLALFGLPLSDTQAEVSSDGRTYIVQWFERARFEVHPENTPPYDILLGLLGAEIRNTAQSPTPTATSTPTATTTPTATQEPTRRPRPTRVPTIQPTTKPIPSLPAYP
jgi:hypothetical protein